MNSLDALVALNQLPRIGPVRVRRLLAAFGSAEAVLGAGLDRLMRVDGIGEETAAILHRWQDHADPVAELREAAERGISVIACDDPSFPAPLLQAYDHPLLLYVWGRLEPRDRHAIGVVGSRRSSHYGNQCAKQFSFLLAQAGFTIVSGLARGIDTAAHEGAVAAGGRTIAVVGSGLARLYPPENLALAERIADGRGAVVSEFPLHTVPDKQTFPMRNRIVAAWSQGLLVVECPAWSGSLITANLASDYGKPIFAVPGPIDRPNSAGCHQLIRDGATLVTHVDHLLEDLGELPLRQGGSGLEHRAEELADGVTEGGGAGLGLAGDEASIYAALGQDEISVDELVEKTGLAAPVVTATLMKLEIRRMVRALPGFRYLRR